MRESILDSLLGNLAAVPGTDFPLYEAAAGVSLSGHKVTQPGLRGHSHDPASDLLKRFMVERRVFKDDARERPYGWLGVASFDTVEDATDEVVSQRFFNLFDDIYRIFDTKEGRAV